MAVNEGVSLAISCCQPPNRSAISLTTLILLVLTVRRRAKYGQPPEMKEGRGKGREDDGRDRNKVIMRHMRFVFVAEWM